LRDGRADLVVGATNEPPVIPKLRWFEFGVMEWIFAISPRHPLAKAKLPLEREQIADAPLGGGGRLLATTRCAQLWCSGRAGDARSTGHVLKRSWLSAMRSA
jgi:DNA-binding transcriptional LysR family regulator